MLGRRKTIFVGSFIMCIGALLQCTSYQLGQFIVGRLVTGFGRCNESMNFQLVSSATQRY